MVPQRAAAALLTTEGNFRRIMRYRDLWTLKAPLSRNQHSIEEQVA
jgi:hypothetical protein